MRSGLVFAVLVLLSLASCISPTPKELPPPPDVAIVGSATLFDKITIEIVPVANFTAINKKSTDALIKNLNDYLICRSANIKVIIRKPVNRLRLLWTYDGIVGFENSYRKVWDRNLNDRHLKLFVACFHGKYVDNNTTGLRFGSRRSIALFENTYQRSLLLHEIGHVIGLVDRSKRKGPPANPERASHCNTESCVMYWELERSAVFDGKCTKDILNMIRKGTVNGHTRRANRDCTKASIYTPSSKRRRTSR